MIKKLCLLPLLCFVVAAQAQYSETFSTPDQGYLVNLVDDFSQVTWTLSSWDLQPPAEFGRDASDYFATTAAGLLEAIDLDQEVCWMSPGLFVLSDGNIAYTADIAWEGFDSGQTNPSEHINVEYQINSSAWVRHPNVLGVDGDPLFTVSYINAMGNNNGSATTNFPAIATLASDTLHARICVSTNANAELVTIDNVNITGVIPLVSKVNSIPAPTLMLQILPNPFSDVVSISWEMPSAGDVQMELADVQGKIIYRHMEAASAGLQEWQWRGRDAQGARVPAGVYIMTLRGEGWQVSKQLVKE